MAFYLNTKSGYLHTGDHGSGMEFERADAADQYASKNDMKMTFCSTCFPDNRNSKAEAAYQELLDEQEKRAGKGKVGKAEADAAMTPGAADTDEDAAGSPTEFTTAAGTTPPALTPSATGDRA